MKHLQPYEGFINENSNTHKGVKEITESEFKRIIANRFKGGTPPSDEEIIKIGRLYKYIDPENIGEFRTKVQSNIFRLDLNIDKKLTTKTLWKVSIEKIPNDEWVFWFVDKTINYYKAQSLDDAIAYIAGKYGPDIDWDKIK